MYFTTIFPCLLYIFLVFFVVDVWSFFLFKSFIIYKFLFFVVWCNKNLRYDIYVATHRRASKKRYTVNISAKYSLKLLLLYNFIFSINKMIKTGQPNST